MQSADRFLASLTEEGRYRLLLEAITDYAIYMLDLDGRVTSWNAGAQRFKGYEAHEILGENYGRFFTPDDRAAGLPRKNLERALRDGRYEGEGWRLRKDGTTFWAHVVLDTILDPEGSPVGFAKITRDLTERKNTEVELERTREALFQSQKMEAIGQLTGGVAHDFNNLLTVILGSLELVQRRLPPDPRITPLLGNALQAAQRGASLTQRMLAFARRQDLKMAAVDLHQLCNGVTGIIERAIGAEYVVDVRVPANLPPVSTDANQLESALLNLAVNARDAMPNGGKLTIEAEEAAAPPGGIAGRSVEIRIIDTGEGMAAATLERAIEPFFTTKGTGKGTGLGLSMVQGLVAQSGGKLVLESEIGKGTSVHLFLPVALDDKEMQMAQLGAPSEASGENPGLRVLVVDDDPLVLMNTAAILEDMGHQPVEASSGTSALEILRSGDRFDIVVSDYSMPGMNGRELMKEVELLRPGMPFVLATGYAELPAGDNDAIPHRLAKPFFQQDLAQVMENATRTDATR